QGTVAAYCTMYTNLVGGLMKTSSASKGTTMASAYINVRNHNMW
ncbi:unnamed protein product, partial [marine sediment metagenome]